MIVRPVASALALACQILIWVLLASVLLSWVELIQRSSRSRINLDNTVVRFIEGISYTLLHPIRRVIDPYQRSSGFDFSPIVAIIVLSFVREWVIQLPF
jgi:uncharacterized protein YggT (Ycf19 family)